MIVTEKPLPPDDEVSRGSKEDTVPTCSTSISDAMKLKDLFL